MASPQPVRTGIYIGTGAAKDVFTVGYAPRYIKFVNLTTGAAAEFNDCMDPATVVTHDSGTDAVDTAQGVTLADQKGFSIGTNAVINNSGDTITWTASV